jgi:hypothetical protein
MQNPQHEKIDKSAEGREKKTNKKERIEECSTSQDWMSVVA